MNEHTADNQAADYVSLCEATILTDCGSVRLKRVSMNIRTYGRRVKSAVSRLACDCCNIVKHPSVCTTSLSGLGRLQAGRSANALSHLPKSFEL